MAYCHIFFICVIYYVPVLYCQILIFQNHLTKVMWHSHYIIIYKFIIISVIYKKFILHEDFVPICYLLFTTYPSMLHTVFLTFLIVEYLFTCTEAHFSIQRLPAVPSEFIKLGWSPNQSFLYGKIKICMKSKPSPQFCILVDATTLSLQYPRLYNCFCIVIIFLWLLVLL